VQPAFVGVRGRLGEGESCLGHGEGHLGAS
jgi:hypothetical protein